MRMRRIGASTLATRPDSSRLEGMNDQVGAPAAPPGAHIGASSWLFDGWKGVFYPDKTPASGYLAHYVTQFDSVEVNTSYYALPRAADVPPIQLESLPSPTATNPLGVKGCGEAGCAAGLPTIVNAVIAALADEDIQHLDMPLTPEKIWAAIVEARAARKTSA